MNSRPRIASITGAAIAALLCPMATGGEPDAVPTGAVTVLDAANTYWRWLRADRPAVLVGDAAAERVTVRNRKITPAEANALRPAVPAGWPAVDFDDSAWPRTAGGRLANLAFMDDSKDFGGGILPFCRGALVCLRGKFRVDDPKAVRALHLSIECRGGIVVHLNGREVARAHLPAGELTAATPADPYPAEAFVGANGKPLPWAKLAKPDDTETRRRIALRKRSLGPLALPTGLLREGTNVLAVAIRRSDFDPAAKTWFRGYTRGAWSPLGLTGLKLQAVGTGATANVGRRSGAAAVFNQDRNDRTTVRDYGDPCEPLRPIALAAARNGTFSGKIVVASDKPVEGLRAVAGELKAVKGGGAIPASGVRVLYSEPIFGRSDRRYLEPLTAAPPVKPTAAAAVWVRVTVPADASAGDYRGTLTVSAGGKKLADVPIELHVADWTLPDAKDFRTFLCLDQSPRALSLQYKTPLWSERHWALMDRSMKLLAGLGNNAVHVPVVENTRLGNTAGWVTWVRQADGSFKHDFSTVEKYLALVKKRLGPQRFVVLHVWHAGGWSEKGAKQANTVTVRDAATGKITHLQVPEFGTPESKAF